jgi:hypothetical protein
MAWRMSHASPPVSPVPLSCAFLALLSHPSHQIAGVDSISLVVSLVLRHARPIRERRRPADYESATEGAGQDPKNAADLRERCLMQRSNTPCVADIRGHFADTLGRHEVIGSDS